MQVMLIGIANENHGDEDDQDSDDDNDTDSRTSRRSASTRKRKRLTTFEVTEIIVEENVNSLIELQALAHQQKKEGKTDLVEFLVNRKPRAVADILNTAWELAQSKKTQLELFQEAKEKECTKGCDGLWMICAPEILANNQVSLQVFRDAVCDLLIKGRGKYWNIMITGNANCGKTLLLNPLTLIFNTFCFPACGSFAWVGFQNAECIFLNDFRWSPQVIPWLDLLLMLEGLFAKDISLTSDNLIFCTGKHRVMYIKNGIVDEHEYGMMDVRWGIFHFTYQIPWEHQRQLPSSARCFAELIFPSET